MGDCRLIYRSTCTDKLMENEALRELIRLATEHNRAQGITGMLVMTGDQFLQVLEGPSLAVNQLYGRIQRDPRHHDLMLISYQPVEERYFEDWNMSLVDLYDLPKSARQYLASKYPSSADGAVQIPERLHEVYAFLLDAKYVCVGRPWEAD